MVCDMSTPKELLDMITPNTRTRYAAHMRIVESCERDSLQHDTNENTCNQNTAMDTVGVIVLDDNGLMCTATSSGGISIKVNGRIGSSAIPGCGLHIQEGIAVTCSGCGEDLIRLQVAMRVAQYFRKGIPANEWKEFGVFGAICLKVEEGIGAEIMWAHTSDSFCLAYCSTELDVKTCISRGTHGKLNVGGAFLKSNKNKSADT